MARPGSIAAEANASRRLNIAEITRQISATIGTEFFESLVRNIGHCLNADFVYIGEFVGGQEERVRKLASFGRELVSDGDYALAGSAIAQIATGEPLSCTRAAQEKFPSDQLLAEAGAQAFVAVPLLDAQRRALGVMLAAFRHPLADTRTQKSALETFAPRVSAEIRRKQADADLRESEQRYHVFIAQNTEAMWRIEFEKPISTDLPEDEQIESIFRYGYLAECNDAMARLLGREKAQELVGSTFEELSRRAEPNLREDLRATIRSGYRFDTVETRPIDADGHLRHHLRSHWCIVEDGKLQRIWGTVRDVTELKRTEEALHASEQRLSELLGSIRLLTVMLDDDGSIAYCNNHLLQLTGWKPGELAGKSWFDLMIPPEERQKLKAEFASTSENPSELRNVQSTLLGKDGRRWTIAWETSVLRDADGRVTGSAGVGREIGGRGAIQEGLTQSRKLQNMRLALAKLVHDLNGEMTVITGYCSILLQDKNVGDACHGPAMEIQRAAQQGIALTQDMLALDRDRPDLKLLDLNAIIEDVGRTIQPSLPPAINLEIELDPSLGNVRTDEVRFRQALLNLVTNAIEAMPEGGRLTVHSSNIGLDEEQASNLSGIAAGDYVLVAVADTGCGMTEETQEHLFEPFFTTKGKAGMGLSAVYEIVQESHGHILVESKADRGTVFHMYFPRVSA